MKRALHILVAAITMLVASCGPDETPEPLKEIAGAAEALRADLVAIRRDVHSHPEISGDEARTAALVAERLRAMNLEVRTAVGGHGVVGILRGAAPGPVVLYRADMDAMPQQEPPGLDYASTVPGVFHVCGHDLHVAVGIGVATILSRMRERLAGTVVFLFQPGEETLQGAAAMIAAGALDDPVPDVAYAIHAFPLPVGAVAHGARFAGSDSFTIEVTGALATPAVATELQTALAPIGTVTVPTTKQEITSLLTVLGTPEGPLQTSTFLMTMSKLEADRLTVRGSVKASADEMYVSIRATVEDAADSVLGPGTYDLTFRDAPFPSMVSDASVSAAAAPVLAELLGEERVVGLHATVPFASEDFALMLERVPGTMILVGIANHDRDILGLPHMPNFEADEEGIVVGTKAMAALIWRRLSQP